VVAYLGIVLAGCVVVAVADSFPAAEIAARLRIAGAKAIVTQASRCRCRSCCHRRCSSSQPAGSAALP
jgi:acetyl-CoA synthetase